MARSSFWDDMTWSYSRVNGFEDCPYKWYLRYIEELEGEDTFFASYGSFVHSLIDRHYKEELTPEQLTMLYLLGFRSSVHGRAPSMKVFRNYFSDGLRYFENFVPLPGETIATELKVEFKIDGIPVLGFIDHVGRSDGLVITDNKSRALKPFSGKSKPTKSDVELEEYLRQLYIYSVPIVELYGEEPSFLCFNCFRTGEIIKCEFDRQKQSETVTWFKEKVEKIKKTTDFAPRVDWFKCNYLCEYGNLCEYKKLALE